MDLLAETLEALLAAYGPALLRLAAAAVCGGLIGLERSAHGRSAGMRTQMLIALGAALAMLVSLEFGSVYAAGDSPTNIHVDPARVAYGVMGGVGFLGAGAIMRFGLGIRGLTTAASMWCTAAVGLACGFGMYLTAGLATALVLGVLRGLVILEGVFPRPLEKELTFVTTGSAADAAERFTALLDARRMQVTRTSIRRNLQTDTTRVSFLLRLKKREDLDTLIRLAEQAEGVQHLKIE